MKKAESMHVGPASGGAPEAWNTSKTAQINCVVDSVVSISTAVATPSQVGGPTVITDYGEHSSSSFASAFHLYALLIFFIAAPFQYFLGPHARGDVGIKAAWDHLS